MSCTCEVSMRLLLAATLCRQPWSLLCRAHRPYACGQCQGTAVPTGGTACESQYQVPADTQGLQGLLRASGAAVTSCHCGPLAKQAAARLACGSWVSNQNHTFHYRRIVAERSSRPVVFVVMWITASQVPAPGSRSAAHNRPRGPLHHQPCTNACTQNALPDTALLAARAGKRISSGCGACVVTNLVWHLA